MNTSPPYCPHCGCMMPREGEYCQSCRVEHGYESDECTCYVYNPEDCTSKLEHYCCCEDDDDSCRATNHS